jgi:hypothetical protein
LPVEFVETILDSTGAQLKGQQVYFQVVQPWAEHDRTFSLGITEYGDLVTRDSRDERHPLQGWRKVRTLSVVGKWELHPDPLYNEQVADAQMRLTDNTVLDGIVVVVPEGVEVPG